MGKDEQQKMLEQMDEVEWLRIKKIFGEQWGITADEMQVTFKSLPESEDLIKTLCWLYFSTGLKAVLIYMNRMGRMQSDWAQAMQEKIKADVLSKDLKEEITQ